MIPIEHKDEVISTGISFLRSITLAYGQEVGLELWDTIADTLDKDVKGQIFFSMLTGESGSCITIRDYDRTNVQRVAIILTIREVTGLGLKEAKDLADVLIVASGGYGAITNQVTYSMGHPVVLEIQRGKNRNACVSALRNVGCVI